jgi:hypothetical protein
MLKNPTNVKEILSQAEFRISAFAMFLLFLNWMSAGRIAREL